MVVFYDMSDSIKVLTIDLHPTSYTSSNLSLLMTLKLITSGGQKKAYFSNPFPILLFLSGLFLSITF